MELTTHVNCVVLLLALFFKGYEYTELNEGQWQPPNNVQSDIGTDAQNDEDTIMLLKSIFGKDALDSILKDSYGKTNEKQVEPSDQSYLNPNIQFGLESNTQNENKKFSENHIIKNNQDPWEDRDTTSKGKNDYDTTFTTVFPFHIFNGNLPHGQGETVPESSSNRPETPTTGSPFIIISSSEPIPKTDVYSTTPSYWHGNQAVHNPVQALPSVASDVNPTEPSINLNTQDEVTSISSSLKPEKHTEFASSTQIPFNTGDEEDNSSPAPSALNPIRPNYYPNILVRPSIGYSYNSYRSYGQHNRHQSPYGNAGSIFRPYYYDDRNEPRYLILPRYHLNMYGRYRNDNRCIFGYASDPLCRLRPHRIQYLRHHHPSFFH